jgi:hypothetical protein
MVNGKSVIKYFGCCSFKPARGAKQIAPASKNKLVENWYRFWFYHKVSLVEEKNQANRVIRRYPLAARMHKNIFDCKPEFQSLKSSKSCEKFYKLAASIQSDRDICEEYIASWSFVRFHEKVVRGKTYIFSDNKVFRPKKYTEDKEFISAVEIKAVEILEKILKKEKDLMDKILGSD